MLVPFAVELSLLFAPVYYCMIQFLSSLSDLHLHLPLLSFQVPPGNPSSEMKQYLQSYDTGVGDFQVAGTGICG